MVQTLVIVQTVYRIIYHPALNPILLWINRLFSPITKFQLPPSGTIKIKTDEGAQFKMITNQTSYVTKLLYWNGANSFEYTPVFKKLVTSCNVFIDIGANTGYYSLVASMINKEIEVHSFEPAQGPLHYLNKNVMLNNLEKRISVHPIALSGKSGSLNFYEVRNKKYSYLPHNLGGVGSLVHDESKTAYSVKTETLDSFINEKSISTIDLIKIDTEGTENLILEGAEKIIRKFQPIIICETLFNRIESKLEAIMKNHGYLFFNYKNRKLEEVSTLFREADNGVRDCFFVPLSKLHLIKEFIK